MKKRIVPILIICIVIILLITVLNGRLIYLGNNTKVLVFGSKIIKFNYNPKIVLRSVNIYKDNNKTINGYIKSTKHDKEYNYYLVSRNNKEINTDDLIASGLLNKLSVYTKVESSTIDQSSLDMINNLLEKNINTDDIYNYKKITYDIDNDSNKEDIIALVFNDNGSFANRIFINDNNLVNVIDYNVSFSDEKNIKSYGLVGLVDFNKDDIYEIVVSRVDGDSQPAYYDIFSYDNGSIKEIK